MSKHIYCQCSWSRNEYFETIDLGDEEVAELEAMSEEERDAYIYKNYVQNTIENSGFSAWGELRDDEGEG